MSEKLASNDNPEMEVSVLSEEGLRPENQDWMSWSRIPWGECYIVADGMGGYKGGALAARMTVEGLEKHLKEQPSDLPFDKALTEAVRQTNAEVHRMALSGNPDTDHMGSTLAIALISGNQLQVGHIGDSRIYLFRQGRLKLLTIDHTSVQRMLEAGMINQEQARTHPDAHILSRAVGSKPEVEVEIGKPLQLEDGDGILLCSDGLSGYVEDQQIEKIVASQTDVQSIPKQLVDLALKSGGDDNITVQFVRYGKPVAQTRRQTARLPEYVEQPAGVREVIRKIPGSRTVWGGVIAIAIVALALPQINRLTSDWRNGSAERVAVPPTAGPAGGSPAAAPTTGGGTTPTPASGPATGAASAPATGAAGATGPVSKVPTPASTPAPGPPPKETPKSKSPATPASVGKKAPAPPPVQKKSGSAEPSAASSAPAAPTGGAGSVGNTNPAEQPVRVAILVAGNDQKTADSIRDGIKDEVKKFSDRPIDFVSRDLGSPPSSSGIWIFYPDEEMRGYASRLKSALDNLNLFKDKVTFGKYHDDWVQKYQEAIDPTLKEKHLLIVFPEQEQ